MSRIKIGAVAYLNTLPLVHGLERGPGAERIELSYEVPSRLAELMAAGRLDVALLPVIELARIPGLELVPGLGIVTRGPSRSVLLLSRCPLEDVRSLALDPESRTSNALAQVLLQEVWRRRPQVRVGSLDPAADLEVCDAVVRIGDKALFDPLPQGAEVHDLGEVWTGHTGLPFVFAAWIARPGVVDRELYRLLHASRRAGSQAVRQIADDYAYKGRRHPELALDYLTRHIRFRLGADEIRAIERFLGAAEAAGLIGSAPRLRMALERWSECHETAAERGLIGRTAEESTP